MVRKLSIVLVTVVVAALLAPSASGGGKAKTEVSFGGISYDAKDGKTDFNGTVSSPRKDCANKRKVTVYFVQPGADDKVGSKKTSKDGADYRWLIRGPGVAPPGDYYAKAEAGDTCKGDKSQRVEWGPLRAAEERKPAKTKLTLRLEYIKESQTRIWRTRIKSEKAKCEPQRQMHVYQKVPGPDTELGQSTSDENGRGGVSDSGQPPFAADEFYYAKVPFKSNKCDAIKSKTVNNENSTRR